MLIPFKPWHLQMMKLTQEVREIAKLHAVDITRLADSELAGTVVSNSDLPRILGVVGALPLAPDVCEVFVVSAEDRKRFPIEFVKSVRQVLDHARTRFAKITALGEDTPFFNRWFSWLGFTAGGLCDRPGCEGLRMWSMAGRA